MKKLIIVILVCFGLNASAQVTYNSSGRTEAQRKRDDKKKKDKDKGFSTDRIVAGGGLGLSFGNVTAVSVSPMIGYRITDNFAAGVRFGYQYLKVKDFYEIPDFNNNIDYYDLKSSIFSTGVWARYLIMQQLFAHVEYEHNFMSFTQYGFDPGGSGNIVGIKTKYNAPSLLIGAGFRQPLSERVSFGILALYDVIQDKYSPYLDRIEFRTGFLVNF
jgi:hypothetical protein